MEETKRNSVKLDIEAVRLSENDREQPVESYKSISEVATAQKLPESKGEEEKMVREKSEKIEDGADESMLGGLEKEQLARKDEVKFISGDHTVNGDAKIDIGAIDKTFTGMTKEELMKYANDPFWVRLRWIFFILFWGLWIAMLAGAILIILKAPKCSAPVPLSWYKEGPLIQLPTELPSANIDDNLKEHLKKMNAKGVIYKLPGDKTYAVHTDEVREHIKTLVEKFKNTTINVVLDLTPNYVTTENELYIKALENETYQSAFVWSERARLPTNWVKKDGSGNAWKEVKPQNFVLRQFGENNVDLDLNDTYAKNMFKDVLRSLIKLGVKGFRLSNSKHFIINKHVLTDNQVKIGENNKGSLHSDYEFWEHKSTTNQLGIGQLLKEFTDLVKNQTNGEGFLSITEKIEKPEAFKIGTKAVGFDLPIFSVLPLAIVGNNTNIAESFKKELTKMVENWGHQQWPQWICVKDELSKLGLGTSEYNMFLFLLPGVPVGTIGEIAGPNSANIEELKDLDKLRSTPSFQHGAFDVFTDLSGGVIAYSRIKTGNPGYFVAFNPTANEIKADFSFVKNLADQLTVEMVSRSFNVTGMGKKAKVRNNDIRISARSSIILTYVPKSDD